MGPPTEQLIRDYLYRLSVAARGQLGPDDRRALVDRTRDFIERETGLAGPPTAIEVGRLLAGLGDPAALVQQERQRLTTIRGEVPTPENAGNPITRMLRRDYGKARRASWRWPAVAGSRTDLPLTLLANRSAGASVASSNGTATGDGDPSAPGEPASDVPVQSRDPDWFFRALGREPAAPEPATTSPVDGTPGDSLPVGDGRPPWPLAGALGASAGTPAADDEAGEPDEAAPTTVSPAWQLATPREPVLSPRVRQALTATVSWYRQRPLEASAVALLGLGGAIYPPIWLLGAVVALASRFWDGRDKWLGLALPVLVPVIAAALGVATSGHASVGHAMHEGWVFGVAGSRLAAALSAGYLCWRSVRGRRPPAVPPWNRPHNVN